MLMRLHVFEPAARQDFIAKEHGRGKQPARKMRLEGDISVCGYIPKNLIYPTRH